MTVSVAVAGASGYAGAELVRLLSAHPHVSLGALTAHTNAGESVGAHHPHLRELAGRTFTETNVSELKGHDVVFLALPHGASAAMAKELPSSTIVIDCGADFRLESATAWEKYYGGPHAGTWVYGMPELANTGSTSQRELIAGSNRIAVPGCNVMAVTLAMQPAFASTNPLIDATQIVAVLANGYSGAGKALRPHLMASEAFGSATPYAVGGSHRHIPEIEQNLRNAGAQGPRLSFTPTLVPMARGILATVSAPLRGNASEVRRAWENAYRSEPAVSLLPEGQWPTTAATTGANVVHVQVTIDDHAGRIIAVSALDNLVKGTAGTAIQAMNLTLGFDEFTALTWNGIAP